MKLRHAILGLLSHHPQSGYDLSRAFSSSVVHFWYADQSQIYRTLDRLEADGAISTRVIPQSGRPDRRVHSLTESGLAELDAWLTSPLEPHKDKDPFLARVFFISRLGHERADELLAKAEQECRQELEALETIDLDEADAVDLDTTLKVATLRLGIDTTRTYLEWILRTRRTIAAWAQAQAEGAQAPGVQAEGPAGAADDRSS